jgi:hypothetical protein
VAKHIAVESRKCEPPVENTFISVMFPKYVTFKFSKVVKFSLLFARPKYKMFSEVYIKKCLQNLGTPNIIKPNLTLVCSMCTVPDRWGLKTPPASQSSLKSFSVHMNVRSNHFAKWIFQKMVDFQKMFKVGYAFFLPKVNEYDQIVTTIRLVHFWGKNA